MSKLTISHQVWKTIYLNLLKWFRVKRMKEK